MSREQDGLLLIGRPDCGLCEEMLMALLPALEGSGVSLRTADIDDEPDWQRRYGLRIPVLLDAWGETLCEGHFDVQALQEWLAERQRR